VLREDSDSPVEHGAHYVSDFATTPQPGRHATAGILDDRAQDLAVAETTPRVGHEIDAPHVPLDRGFSPATAGPGSFRTKTEAKDARTEARRRVDGGHGPDGITVRAFALAWTTDRLFARPKRSTNIHNEKRIQGFVDAYGDLPLGHVGDLVVAQYLAGGSRDSTVPALRAMFNDAMSAKARRVSSQSTRSPTSPSAVAAPTSTASRRPRKNSLRCCTTRVM